jgi:uncharacterized protein YecE (DUF72 family)
VREPQQAVTAGRPAGNIYYGTSSWTDRTLLESKAFYPPAARKPEDRLRYYAEHFPLVEVDSSFYALPSERNAELWAERTPEGFMFNVKAFGLMTHHAVATKSLPQNVRALLPEETAEKPRVYARDLPPDAMDLVWEMFGSALEPLAASGKLGAILFQFPHWFAASRANVAYLQELAERSPAQPAIEFRGAGWMKEDKQERTFGLLREIGATYVVVDEPQGFGTSVPPVVACTSPDLAMIRFHGHNAENWEKRGITAAERFRYLYNEDELREWVAPARELAHDAKQLHVLMNNCYADYGVRNAAQFGELVRRS